LGEEIQGEGRWWKDVQATSTTSASQKLTLVVGYGAGGENENRGMIRYSVCNINELSYVYA